MLQINKGLAQLSLFDHLVCNLRSLSFTDTLDLRKSLRFFFYNSECVLSKGFHYPFGKSLPYSLDGSRTQIAFHTKRIIRRNHPVAFCLHLHAIHGMLHIISLYIQCFSRLYIPEEANTYDLLFLFYYTQYSISIFPVLVYDMVYISMNLVHFCSSYLFFCDGRFYPFLSIYARLCVKKAAFARRYQPSHISSPI